MNVRIVEPNQAQIRDAAERLRAGGVVAFPTETVYGLGCATFSFAAIELVYELKGRPRDNPLIAHVPDADVARSLAQHWNPTAAALCHAFWPGALTLVVQRSPRVPPQASAGRATLAVRCPAHPVAQRLLTAFGEPISAPSANRSGHISATTAQHAVNDFTDVSVHGMDELMVIDGGPTAMGIESTVIDVTTEPPRILRPGSITADQIERVLVGPVQASPIAAQDASPGTAERHYAPSMPAVLIGPNLIEHGTPLPAAIAKGARIAVLSHSRPSGTWADAWIAMPPDPERYAARLYDVLRTAEAMDIDAIAIESPPTDDPAWAAILDRLRRATA